MSCTWYLSLHYKTWVRSDCWHKFQKDVKSWEFCVFGCSIKRSDVCTMVRIQWNGGSWLAMSFDEGLHYITWYYITFDEWLQPSRATGFPVLCSARPLISASLALHREPFPVLTKSLTVCQHFILPSPRTCNTKRLIVAENLHMVRIKDQETHRKAHGNQK